MSKKIVIAVAVLVLLGIVGVGYVMMPKSAPSQEGTPTTEQPKSTMQSLKDLLTSGQSVSCSVDYGDNSQMNGKTYVSGKRVRADFTGGHMIQDGTYAYMWSDTQATGTKIKVDAMAELAKNAATPTGQTQKTQTVDENEKASMNCSAWITDESQFVPPTNITFTDLSEMLKKLPAMPKGTCDAITDPTAKAACESSLGN